MLSEVLKIATNTHHLRHPFCEGADLKSGRYTDWQGEGVLLFAIATIFTLGIATCFYIATAYFKHKEIVEIQNRNNTEQRVDHAKDIALNQKKNNIINTATNETTASTTNKINLKECFDRITDKLIKEIENTGCIFSSENKFLFMIRASDEKNNESIKHCFLDFVNDDSQSKQKWRDTLPKFYSQLEKEIGSSMDSVAIEWNVLIQHPSADGTLVFAQGRGNLKEDPDMRLNHSGTIAHKSKWAKRGFEKVITKIKCPTQLIDTFAFPTQEEPSPDDELLMSF